MTAGALPTRMAKKLAGECMYSGCHQLAKDGASYCDPHHEQVKAKDREWRADQRDGRRAARLCLDCGARCGGWRRCKPCRKKQLKRRRVDSGSSRVDSDGQIPGGGFFRAVSDPRRPGPAMRYVGRSHRGAPTTEERNAEILRDHEEARLELGRSVIAFGLVNSDEVAELPRIQREEAAREAGVHAAKVARIAASIHERLDKSGRHVCCVCQGHKGAEIAD